MGEAKRKRDAMTDVERLALDVSRKLANEGKLIAGGWAAYCVTTDLKPDNPQYDELKIAYESGAEHLFSSIMGTLDEDREPTDADMRRMDLIYAEIQDIRERVKLRVQSSKGNA